MRIVLRPNRIALSTLLLAIVVHAPLVRAQGYDRLSRSDLKTIQESFADVAEDVIPSVVAIRTYIGTSDFGDRSVLRSLSQGSGVIIRSNGFILTNYHVIEDATHISVILHNGTEHDASALQIDVRSDLAVLKIDADHLRAAKFGDLKSVRIGHWAFAIGNPFGLANFTGRASFTVGNISAFGRNLTDQLDLTDNRYYGNLIETSAAINPGNSGGPLFNVDGEVIGIVTAIETSSGVTEGAGFAIPISDRTRAIIKSLERGDEVRYGYLGVRVDRRIPNKLHSAGDRKVHGALMGEVLDGPAATAGLRGGDVVIEFDGVPIENFDQLVRVVGATPVGSKVVTQFVRNGRKKRTTIVLGERPLDSRETVTLADGTIVPTINWRGALFAEISDRVRKDLDLAPNERGLMIVNVRPGSDAANRGLQPDQIVIAINRTPVTTIRQLRKASHEYDGKLSLKLQNNAVVRFDSP